MDSLFLWKRYYADRVQTFYRKHAEIIGKTLKTSYNRMQTMIGKGGRWTNER